MGNLIKSEIGAQTIFSSDIRITVEILAFSLNSSNYTDGATIDLEPKIRTAENLILLSKKKIIVSACTTNIPYVCLYISRNHLLQQCPILDFLLGIFTKNAFFTCLFLESIKY